MPGAPPTINYSPLEILVSGSKRAQYRTLAAALAAAAPGDRILVGPGTYQIPNGGHVINKAGLEIVGTAPANVKFLAALDASVSFRITADDVRLRGLDFDGQGASQASRAGNDGIYITGTDTDHRTKRTVIEDCYIHGLGNAGHGIHTLWTDQCSIRRCRLESHNTSATTWGGWGSLKGCFVERSSRLTIDDCYLTGWSQAVGFWNGDLQCKLLNSKLIDNFGFEQDNQDPPRSAFEDYGNGVTFGTHGDNLVQNCIVDGSAAQCLEIAQGLSGGRYLGNILRNAGMAVGRASAIYGGCAVIQGQPLLGADQVTTDILFAQNRLFGDNRKTFGLSIIAADRVQAFGNHYSEFTDAANLGACIVNGGNGILLQSEAYHNCRVALYVLTTDSPVTWTGCRLDGTGYTEGVHLAGGAGHILTGNQIDIDAQGINVVAAPFTRLRDNDIRCANRCILVQCQGVRIMGNRVRGTTGSVAALQLDSANAHHCRIAENDLDAAGTIFISAGAHDNYLINNYLVQSAGINTSGAGSGNTVSGNY